MRINDLLFDMVVEEVKNKNLFNELMQKWRQVVPDLTDEQGEKIYNRHSNIKNQISLDNPNVFRFLRRHDGRSGTKVELNDLKDIQKLDFKSLVEFLHEYGKFSLKDENPDEINPEDEKAKLDSIFAEKGEQKTDSKIEASKNMWYGNDNCIINKDGFRVYKILSETHSKRMGYYYQSLHRLQYIKFRRASTAHVNSPWCVTWRGRDVIEHDDQGNHLFTQGGNLYGNYRKNDKKTFYFVIDESKDPMSDDPSIAKYHMSAFQINNYGTYTLTSMFNDGDNTKSWEEIIKIYPQLDGEREKIEYRPMSPEELESSKITDIINENDGDANEFAAQDAARQDQYVSYGGTIKKVVSWNSMSTDLRRKYISMMELHDAFSRISNTQLLHAILNTEGMPNLLDKKLKDLGKDGVGFLVDDFMKKDYVLVRYGQKDPSVRIYQNKATHQYGLYNITTFSWVISGGVTYDDRFSEEKMMRVEDEQGNRYAIKSYGTPNGDMFYVIIDNPTLSDGGEAKGFLVSKQMWEQQVTQTLKPVEGRKFPTMTDYEGGKYDDIKPDLPNTKKKK